MQVTRLAEARPYRAPNHVGTSTLRLHGIEASDSKAFWVGLSHFLPGGGTEQPDATPVEKVTVEGDKLSFKIVRKFGDRTFEVTFEGTVSDSKLTGQVTTAMGTQKVTGTKEARTGLRRRV